MRPTSKRGEPAGPLRRLNEPKPVRVHLRGDVPRAIWRAGGPWWTIAQVRDWWRIEDRWWTLAPVSREYYEVELAEAGGVTCIFVDRVSGAWYEQRVYGQHGAADPEDVT